MPELGGGVTHLSFQSLRGRLWDTRHQWVCIENGRLHSVTPYAGTRHSLVAYSRHRLEGLSAAALADLAAAGFPLPVAVQPTEPIQPEEPTQRCADSSIFDVGPVGPFCFLFGSLCWSLF